jgi:hypothetical protein
MTDDRYRTRDDAAVTAIDRSRRDVSIMEMYETGEHTYKEIGKAHGLSLPATAKIIGREMGKVQQAAAERIRAAEYARLLALRDQVIEVLETVHYHVHNGKITKIVDDMPILQAVDRDLKISEQIRRLFGADMPVRVDHTVAVQYTINGVPMEALR